MSPSSTVWPLEPHTRGKHFVLRGYLNAWLPIMSTFNGRILFIDGFAGPGEYAGGEEGSPLIALRALHEHRAKLNITAEVRFIFIENSEDRVTHLQTLVENERPKLPKNCHVNVVHGTFDETVTSVLDYVESAATRLAPSLVMVDPFGVSDTPMSVIERILCNPKSEVYVSFMYESINRFKTTSEFPAHLDALFGCEEWRDGIDIEDQEERKDFFYGLYENQLRRAGASYVVHFDLYRGNRLIYAIFFGTKNITGCDRMKQAIWKVAPFGDFAFHGTKSLQLTLDMETADFEPLKTALREQFRGKEWVAIEDVIRFVSSDATDYHSGQVKQNTLVPMETDGEIEVDGSTRKRRRTYPDGTKIRFL